MNSDDGSILAIAARLCREEAVRTEELGANLGDALADGGLLSHDVIALLQECDRISQTLADIGRLLDHVRAEAGEDRVGDDREPPHLKLESVRAAVGLGDVRGEGDQEESQPGDERGPAGDDDLT